MLATSDPLPDAEARERAVDPGHNVVLEASAGTGKTHVLVDRYLNLLGHGVDPANILAITFTRKAAAEMRGRILSELRRRAGREDGVAKAAHAAREMWREARERSGDVSISTIDAFCLSLLREFPLEANLDPGFEMADETLIPRLMDEALDRSMDIGRSLSRADGDVRLLFAELREPRLREGLAGMIERRLVVDDALDRALQHAPRDLTAERACEQAFDRLRGVFSALTGGVEGFIANGPLRRRRWAIVADDMRAIASGVVPAPGLARGSLDRVAAHFLNRDNEPRQRFDRYSARDCKSPEAWRIHRGDVLAAGRDVSNVLKGFRRDLNAILSRGVRRLYQIALREYRATLDARGVLDFSETLVQALLLLAQMEEFARSRYRLEGRYHHVLLDEFQDTSRAQWTLVSLLIKSWGEGAGLSELAPLTPSIFVVGDRKQSIYGFRDADVSILDEAGEFVDRLRPDRDSRRAISKSFRAVPALLAFANDLFQDIEKVNSRRDGFRFRDQDRFPVQGPLPGGDALGIAAAGSARRCAELVASEIRRLLDSNEVIRDPDTGQPRAIRPRDIGILFRTKDSHRDFEKALEHHGVPSYVYKGLGFFEADEIQDVLALLRYLAAPESNLRAAAFLRSRFVRLSDPALQALAPRLASALSSRDAPVVDALGREDRLVLERGRASVARWLDLVDRLPPAEVLELILDEAAYAFETRGPRVRQARENLKKIRSIVRRVQNRGYATMWRVSEHLERLTAGDESNAVIDAGDAVSLMTIHAAKGLEFPAVFVVNLGKGTGGRRSAIRIVSDADSGQAWLSVGDFQSDADEDSKAKEREETKRLLYVAVTRARDRLYLASDVKDGTWKPSGGSLGEVLPATLRTRFEIANASPPPATAEWTAASGQTHAFRVCSVSDHPRTPYSTTQADAPGERDDFSALNDSFAVPHVAVTEAVAAPASANRWSGFADRRSPKVAGTLVHRLFERCGLALAGDPEASISDELEHLLRDDDALGVDDLERVLREAREAYLGLSRQPALVDALSSGEALFEVPFSVRPSGHPAILRGTFDCLVRRKDGRMIVLELKTGKPAPEHERQLSVYVAAARALFPDSPVEGTLVYARNQTVRE